MDWSLRSLRRRVRAVYGRTLALETGTAEEARSRHGTNRSARSRAVPGTEGGRRARVLNIQRMSTEDGPGIRTTVFFKGCNLACDWCHNPESISPQPQTVWNRAGCLACGSCVHVCERDALRFGDESLVLDRSRCVTCGQCAEACPAAVMEVLGRPWTIDELVDEVVRDRAYFERSGGGVTVSGGEPAVQATFVEALLQRCQQEGLHTVLDTCGMCSEARLLSLAARADLVLYDLKLWDSDLHRRHTGQGNERIFDNAVAVARMIQAGGGPDGIWVRTPLIPGVTTTTSNIAALGAFISRELGSAVQRWELCAFNNLCESKYERLGMAWTYQGVPLLRRQELNELEKAARDAGVAEAYATGTARRATGGSDGFS